jgi:flagellar motor switch protein FliG
MSQDETIDGAAIAALIISRMNTVEQDRVLRAIETKAPSVAAKLEEKIFDFDRIADMRDYAVQNLLHEVPPRDLAISLKAAGDQVKEKILSNLPVTKQRAIQADLQDLPPMRISDVQAAQRRILRKLDELYPDGSEKPDTTQGPKKKDPSPWTA